MRYFVLFAQLLSVVAAKTCCDGTVAECCSGLSFSGSASGCEREVRSSEPVNDADGVVGTDRPVPTFGGFSCPGKTAVCCELNAAGVVSETKIDCVCYADPV